MTFIIELESEGWGEEIAAARKRFASELSADQETSLKTLRLTAGLSQAQLAEKIGTSQSRIARLEAGKEDPGFTTMKKICEALGVDLNELGEALDG